MTRHHQVIIIGAGATGSGLARDLALRGVDCLLIEQSDVNAGASGRNHGLLHSGARYAMADPGAALECSHEGAIIKRIMPQCVDDCGGLFAAVPGDDEDYIRAFPGACAAAGIACEAVQPAEARKMEPALTRDIVAAFAVPDAAVDPFMLSLENIADAARHGSRFLRRHQVTGFYREGRRLTAITVLNRESGENKTFYADEFVIAAGGWSGRIAALAGCGVDLLLSKGTLLITQTRLARRVINRLRGPGDGDILVPGGSVSVLGTTSIPVTDPDDNTPTIAEVDANLNEAIPLLPLLATTAFRRAYAGIRPLVKRQGADGRKASRDFALVTHEAEEAGGTDNLITLTGGKLTTYRLMAERAADALCARLGVIAPCRTAQEIIQPSELAEWSDPGLAHKYAWWQKHSPDDYLLCECEVVPQSGVDSLLAELGERAERGEQKPAEGIKPETTGAELLSAVASRSRVGKGSCQGTFCGARITAHLYDCALAAGTEGAVGLRSFLRERWRGQRPVLWGDQLGQAELKEALYFGLMGLNDVDFHDADAAKPVPAQSFTFPAKSAASSVLSSVPLKAAKLPMRSCDVFVAGCGMAGAAAALFAAKSGLSVIQAGGTAEIVFASGLFDVYGEADPWQAITDLRRDHPEHPYALLEPADVRAAMDEFLGWMGSHGLTYRHAEGSSLVLTPMGAFKRTWAVPETMWAGVEAVQTKAPTLLIDFAGLREYSAAQIAAVAGQDWPGLRTARLDFPAPGPHPLLPGAMAQTLELAAHREALANAILPLLNGDGESIRYVGLPAVLGMSHPREVLADLESRLGVSVFEIPTLPASVPGMRLKALFENLDREGVEPRRQTRALSVLLPSPSSDSLSGSLSGSESPFRVTLGGQEAEEEILAQHVILATGRFIGRGLLARRDGIHERLMNLPVLQPENRERWHSDDLFASGGHPVNRAGVVTDEHFRPLDTDGRLIHPRLHAIGTLLAQQDWMREKCGVGLAVATAKAAILACLAHP